MFLDPLSELTQAGKMEEERVYSGGAVFRQNKSYIAFDEDGRKDVKFKGVSRSATVGQVGRLSSRPTSARRENVATNPSCRPGGCRRRRLESSS